MIVATHLVKRLFTNAEGKQSDRFIAQKRWFTHNSIFTSPALSSPAAIPMTSQLVLRFSSCWKSWRIEGTESEVLQEQISWNEHTS